MQLDYLIPVLLVGFILFIIIKNVIINGIKSESPIQIMNYLYNPGYMFIDVRDKDEFFAGHIPKSVNIPFSQISSLLKQIPNDKQLIIASKSSKRSKKAISFLKDKGYDQLINLKGGLLAWQQAGYPLECG